MKLLSRHIARISSVQTLYAWSISKNNIKNIEQFILKEQKTKKIDLKYFKILNTGTINNINKLDQLIKINLTNRKIHELGYIELAILRVAIYELTTSLITTPRKVIINEAIKITKIFCNQNAYKFINGILDNINYYRVNNDNKK